MRRTILSTNDTLPIHPRTGLRAVGIVAGKPVWPIAGGSQPLGAPPVPAPPAGQPAATPPAPAAAPAAPPATGNEPLGEGGKRALEAERQLRADAERRAKAAEDRAAELEAANQTDAERALAAAKAEGRTEAAMASNTRLVRAEVRTAAALAGFNDPADAVAALADRFSEITVTDQGDVDEAAVTAMVAKLATDKAYLLKQQAAAPPAFVPNPGQGTPPAGTSTPSVAAGRQLYEQRKNNPL